MLIILSSILCYSQSTNSIDCFKKRKALVDQLNQGKYKNVLEQGEGVISCYPYDGEVFYFLGYASYMQKEYEEAIEAFKKSQSLGFEVGNAQYNIACSYGLLNNEVMALEWLHKAIKVNPSFYYQWQEDKDFSNVKSYLDQVIVRYDTEAKSRVDKWKADITFFDSQMRNFHYDLFGRKDSSEWNTEIASLKEKINALDDVSMTIELMRLAASVGDGHTLLVPPVLDDSPFHLMPFMSYLFDDGLFVIASKQKSLLGSEIIAINDRPINEVQDLLYEVIPSDNEYGKKWLLPLALSIPEISYGLGISQAQNSFSITYRKNNREQTLRIEAMDKLTPEFLEEWLYGFTTYEGWEKMPNTYHPDLAESRDKPYWIEEDLANNLIIFHYNQVKTDDSISESEFAGILESKIESNPEAILVIDLQNNEGGDNTIYRPILNAIISSKNANKTGKLFALIGRRTFSAGMCFATELERSTDAIFVGEPTGSSPNFIGESGGVFQLPYSGAFVNASNLYWQYSHALDARKYIVPQIPVHLDFNDFKNGGNPYLDAIIEYVATEK